MLNEFSRTELLLKEEGMDRISASRIAVFGLGGVGSLRAERCGVGSRLVDHDRVSLTNINRQLYALHSIWESIRFRWQKADRGYQCGTSWHYL